jgi:hypothetical protein
MELMVRAMTVASPPTTKIAIFMTHMISASDAFKDSKKKKKKHTK